jgi:hypothetical protein
VSRRLFLGVTAGAAAAATAGSAATLAGTGAPPAERGSVPWFRGTRRWVQTNLNEQDPATYDSASWADYWARVWAQGVIVNAGGIVAFYPSRFEWHHRALALGERDLFGEILGTARRAGLTVLARMDSTRTEPSPAPSRACGSGSRSTAFSTTRSSSWSDRQGD